jgi:DNA-binding protein H-NS
MESSDDLRSMSSDELWALYEQVSAELVRRIAAEKTKLEERLRKIQLGSDVVAPESRRRPYPKVLPKYRNPRNPAETWSGRGKQPYWVRAELQSGKKLDDLRIEGALFSR